MAGRRIPIFPGLLLLFYGQGERVEDVSHHRSFLFAEMKTLPDGNIPALGRLYKKENSNDTCAGFRDIPP